MRNDVGLGLVCGFLLSLSGAALGITAEGGALAYAAWLLPATFVVGLALVAHPVYRRFGSGLVLGSLAVAMLVVLFFLWLAAHVGS